MDILVDAAERHRAKNAAPPIDRPRIRRRAGGASTQFAKRSHPNGSEQASLRSSDDAAAAAPKDRRVASLRRAGQPGAPITFSDGLVHKLAGSEGEAVTRSSAALLRKKVQALAAKDDDSMMELAEALAELWRFPSRPRATGRPWRSSSISRKRADARFFT